MARLLKNTTRLRAEACAAQGITLRWTHRVDDCAVAMDRHIIEQALFNILKNAMEATLESRAEDPSRPGRIKLAVEHQAQCVHLSVTDSGNRLGAVPAEQLSSPILATKKGGQGIGLLFVREVLQRHGFAYRLAATGCGETRSGSARPRRVNRPRQAASGAGSQARRRRTEAPTPQPGTAPSARWWRALALPRSA
jgi:nitrogen fixation/metabolism regulation signal transduction histidine kinase